MVFGLGELARGEPSTFGFLKVSKMSIFLSRLQKCDKLDRNRNKCVKVVNENDVYVNYCS